MNQGKRGARSLYCTWRNTSLIVGAALIGMAVWIVAPSVTAYVDAERSLVSVQEYEALLIASRALSAERGPSNVLMSVEVGADPSAVTRLAEARRATDIALSVVDRTRNLPLAPGIVRSLREALGLARDRIDGIAQMPYAERTLDMMTEAIAAMFGIADEIQPTVDLAAETLEKKNPALAGSVFTALIVTNLREQAGRLASYVVPSVSRALPLSPTAAGRVDRTQGRIDQLMQMLGVRLDVSDANLRALMGEVRRLFIGRGVRLIEKLTLEGRAGGHYSIAPAGLTGLYVPTLVPLEDLRKAAIHQMVTDIVRSRDIAFIRLIGMAAATVLLLILLVVVMRRLFLSVLRPLLTAHEMIVGLAEEKPVGRPRFEADTRPGGNRSADRPSQSRPVSRPRRYPVRRRHCRHCHGRHCPGRHGSDGHAGGRELHRRALYRSRRIQNRQRYARALRGRPASARHRRPSFECCRPGKPARASGRRRICHLHKRAECSRARSLRTPHPPTVQQAD
ncbi:hypothetical protein DFI02_101482 [Rhizobium sp. PP-F2F-G20b]|nr:hypothetical protein DFI02_101482 [Rhizobium sp. PP-F2F-G20b]